MATAAIPANLASTGVPVPGQNMAVPGQNMAEMQKVAAKMKEAAKEIGQSPAPMVAVILLGALNIANSIMVLADNEKIEGGISKTAMTLNIILGVVLSALFVVVALLSLLKNKLPGILQTVVRIFRPTLLPLMILLIAVPNFENSKKGYGNCQYVGAMLAFAVAAASGYIGSKLFARTAKVVSEAAAPAGYSLQDSLRRRRH